MGCWNETCAMTHLPIMDGETCYVIPIVESANNERFLGHTSCPEKRFYPFMGVIRGVYDDCGGLKNIEQGPALLNELNKLLAQKIFHCKDEPIESVSSMEEWISMIQRDQITAITFKGARLVSSVFIREECYEWVQQTFASNVKDAVAAIQNFKDLTIAVQQNLFNGDLYMKQQFAQDNLARALFMYSNFIETPLRTAILETDFSFSELAAFNACFLEMRMQWFPTSGAGSQEGINDTYRSFYAMEMQTLQDIERRMDEW